MERHDEIAWIPMCTPEKGKPWFWPLGIADTQRDARVGFANHCGQDWSELRKEGWRIVRIRLTTEIHQ